MLDGQYQFPCGCWATSGGPHWGYSIEPHEHTCDGSVLAADRRQQRAERSARNTDSSKRTTAQLREPLPFSILKNTNKARW